MARVVISAIDNFQIAKFSLPPEEAAKLMRVDDPLAVLEDDVQAGTFFEDEGNPHPEWINTTTGLPMDVNPAVYIIKFLLMPPGHPDFFGLLDDESEVDPADPSGESRLVVQEKKEQLYRVTGTPPARLTPDELDTLTNTNRLTLPPGRASLIFGDR